MGYLFLPVPAQRTAAAEVRTPGLNRPNGHPLGNGCGLIVGPGRWDHRPDGLESCPAGRRDLRAALPKLRWQRPLRGEAPAAFWLVRHTCPSLLRRPRSRCCSCSLGPTHGRGRSSPPPTGPRWLLACFSCIFDELSFSHHFASFRHHFTPRRPTTTTQTRHPNPFDHRKPTPLA